MINFDLASTVANRVIQSTHAHVGFAMTMPTRLALTVPQVVLDMVNDLCSAMSNASWQTIRAPIIFLWVPMIARVSSLLLRNGRATLQMVVMRNGEFAPAVPDVAVKTIAIKVVTLGSMMIQARLVAVECVIEVIHDLEMSPPMVVEHRGDCISGSWRAWTSAGAEVLFQQLLHG